MIEKLMPPTDNGALKRLAGRSNPGSWYTSILEGVQASSGSYRVDSGWFHPSSMGDPCDAALAFQFLGAPGTQEISARTQRIFDLGHGRDRDLKRDTAKAGVSLIKKEEDRAIVIPQLRIRGDLDEWVANPANGEQAIVDFKTIRPDAFKELKEVKHDHYLQVMCYEVGKGVPKGFVLYENKADCDWRLFPANFDQKIWQTEISDRIERILKGLENDIVYRTPVNCTGCPFNANGVCASNDIRTLREKSGLYE